MSVVWITSDWHLGHRSIHRWRQQVESPEHNTHVLVNNYRSVVRKRDVVWFLGDMVFDENLLSLIEDLPGNKRLVLGNHCTDKKVTVPQLCEVFDEVHGMTKYKEAWLTHCPIHPVELRGRYNIHGHVHQKSLVYSNYYNVCPEVNNMFPVKYQKIIEDLRR